MIHDLCSQKGDSNAISPSSLPLAEVSASPDFCLRRSAHGTGPVVRGDDACGSSRPLKSDKRDFDP